MTLDGRRRALVGLLSGHAPFSYKPLRRNLPDLLGMHHRLLRVERPPLDVTLRQIAKVARSPREEQANVELAVLLDHGLKSEAIEAQEEQFRRLPLAIGVSLGFCADAILTRGDQVLVPAFNLRRTPLAGPALRFALSVMHEQSRALNADLASARLALIQFPHPKNGVRHMSIARTDGVPLYSYEELARMAADTQSTWVELLEAAQEEVRKTGTDGSAGWWGGTT